MNQLVVPLFVPLLDRIELPRRHQRAGELRAENQLELRFRQCLHLLLLNATTPIIPLHGVCDKWKVVRGARDYLSTNIPPAPSSSRNPLAGICMPEPCFGILV